uniref:Uncharacterized protein n=1 Tax=Setaria italica TaxID=4555 RepID=K3Y2M9_SETIT
TTKNKWRRRRRQQQQQQQSGRPVLVTFYVIQPRRGRCGSARATSSHIIRHHHHRQHHHQTLHGGHHDERRGGNGGKLFPDNRRADLLEYSRQLRALARQAITAAAAPPPPPPPPLPRLHQRHDIDTVRYRIVFFLSWCKHISFPALSHLGLQAVAVHGDEGHPAAVNRSLERAMSPQQIRRQRCFGSDGWSWKSILLLIFPICINCDGDRGGWMAMTAKRTGTIIKRVGRLRCWSAS